MRDTVSRVTWLMAFMTVGLVLLGVQLYRLTITESEVWRVQAEQQRLQELPRFGARGAIYDRKGRPLATSEPAFAAVLVRQEPEDVEKILPKLAQLLGRNDPDKARAIVERVRQRVREHEGRRYEPIIIERNLPQDVVTALVERQHEFPGVVLRQEAARHYPQGSVAGSVIGYVGLISEEELSQEAFKDYHPEELVGKAGLEKQYERYLRGEPGRYEVPVDPLGRPVGPYQETPPSTGNSLYLTLDLELQRVAEEALAKQIEWVRQQNHDQADPEGGALVVQDVRTGAILAMVSHVSYDPNLLVSHPTEKELREMASQRGFSYLNKALQGYPPGSTFKMATGLAGLEKGVVGPYEEIRCSARYWRYHKPPNWTGYDQGPADVALALALSCNPYFFEVGHLLGIDQLAAFVDKLGFGHKTGIDLPGESPGNNPTRESYGDRWQPGNITSVAIGQGDVLATPLQLANYTATIAMRGKRYRPYLVDEIRTATGKLVRKHEPELIGTVEASEQSWQRIHDGMRLAVTSPRGTAYLAFLGFPVDVAAKTGSAESSGGKAHGLSVAFAPYDDPEIAVSVIIEHGGVGSWTAPVIRRVMAEYFGIDDEIPAIVPTYRDEPPEGE